MDKNLIHFPANRTWSLSRLITMGRIAIIVHDKQYGENLGLLTH